LAMDEQKIRRLTDRGAYAGERLKALFSGEGSTPQPTAHWNDSRFIRFRVTMSVLEQALRALSRSYNAPVDEVSIPYPTRIDEGGVPPYQLSPQQLIEFAQATVANYEEMVAGWDDQTLSDDHVPPPTAVLRLTPPV